MTMIIRKRNDMKSKFMILGCAVASLFAACSSEDSLVASPNELDPNNPNSPNVVVQNSNIPISLSPDPQINTVGAKADLMRSAILSDPSDSTFTLTKMSVFGLAYAKQDPNSIATEPNWANGGFNYCLDNVEYKAEKEEKRRVIRDSQGHILYDTDGITPLMETVLKDDGVTPQMVTVLKPEDDKVRYYPMGGWYKYNFYAFYPRYRANNTAYAISKTSNSISAELDIDGTTDILWGRTRPNLAARDLNAYSANYFGQEANIDTVPVIRMKHVLTRFRFKAVAGPSFPSGESVQGQGIKIVDVAVSNVPRTVTLTIANLSEAAGNGWDEDFSSTVEGTYPTVSATTQNLQLKETDTQTYGGYLTEPYALQNIHTSINPRYLNTSNTSEDIGDGIMLPAGNRDYYLTVSMIDNHYTGDEDIFKNDEPFLLAAPEGGYLPGRSYWIELTINPRKEITARATLIPWQEADAPIGLEF